MCMQRELVIKEGEHLMIQKAGGPTLAARPLKEGKEMESVSWVDT